MTYLPLTFYVAANDSEQRVFCSWDLNHSLINAWWNLKNLYETGLGEHLVRYLTGHDWLDK